MKLTIVDGVLIQAELEENERHIEIPEGCRKIGDEVFEDNPIVISVKLPSSVREIGEYAFQNSSLQNINLEHVEILRNGAFCGCRNIRNLCFGPIECLPMFVCQECDNLETVIIPDTLKEVEIFAFEECRKLEQIDLKNTEIVRNEAFSRCEKLKKIVMNKIRVLEDYFYGCYELEAENVIFGADFEGVEEFFRDFNGPGFRFCKKEYAEFFLESTNHGTEDYSFLGTRIEGRAPKHYRERLTYYKVPEDVVSIGKGSFQDCKHLVAIELHKGMEIEEDAFINCPNLKYLIIPEYDPKTARFFFDEYNDGWGRFFRYPDREQGFCDHIGEESFRQDRGLLYVVEDTKEDRRKKDEYMYFDCNIILRSHWIRMNYFAFDNFMDLKLCAELPKE